MRIKNILQYLESTAARLPDKVAITAGDGGPALTFSALLATARAIGTGLLRHGISGGTVAVFADRSPAAVAAMLGVVYAGGAYVVLDASMPAQRRATILSLGKAGAILYDAANGGDATAHGLPGFAMEVLSRGPEDPAVLSAVRARQIDTDPLYTVFTSGSSGVPKGVVACHRSVIDYGEALTAALDIGEEAVFGCQSPLYFDAPLKELLSTLLRGATTVLIPRRLFSFPVPLLEFITRNGINTVCWVSSALSHVALLGGLTACPPTTLTRVVFGSEVFPSVHYRAWREALPAAVFYQLYGPTEATGMSCIWRADRALAEGEAIPIGVPLDNTGLFLLDEAGREVRPTPGLDSPAGEIYLRGSCLALGYSNNAQATGAAFVQNPLQSAYPETVYRTGDGARYNRLGELVFLGRRDGQIKRRGHRIELGEIEARALALPGVTRAVCLGAGQDQIVLFYTGTAEAAAVMTGLRQVLPRDYLPSRVAWRESFPLTDNGKIDRRRLIEEDTKR